MKRSKRRRSSVRRAAAEGAADRMAAAVDRIAAAVDRIAVRRTASRGRTAWRRRASLGTWDENVTDLIVLTAE